MSIDMITAELKTKKIQEILNILKSWSDRRQKRNVLTEKDVWINKKKKNGFAL